MGDFIEEYVGLVKGDTRSLDNNPYNPQYRPYYNVVVSIFFSIIPIDWDTGRTALEL